jgi:lysophospholipase L1-like esterase
MTHGSRPVGTRVPRLVRKLGLCGLWMACAAPASAAPGDGGLADPNISFVGRWDTSSSTHVTSHWGGSYLSTRFTGRKIAVELNTSSPFKAVINGKISPYWPGQNQTVIELDASTLTHDGPHTLQLVADHESREIPFKRLLLGAGATTLPQDARPLVEFVGDSITAGQGAQNWALGDYAWLTGEALGVHHTQIAWSGITLSDGYHYGTHIPGMESMYFRSWAANRCSNVGCVPDASNPVPNPPWDFSKYSPKVVVVNLGTNDWGLNVPKAEFQNDYTSFLQNVRARHPAAEIVVLRTFNGYNVPETEAAVAARRNAGDNKLHYVDTQGWLRPHPSPDFADGYHPNDTGYGNVRNRLVPVLLPLLGGVTSVNDTQFRYDSAANWPAGWQQGAWQNDNHWSGVANASYEVPFNGTQAHLYGGRAPWHGVAAVSVDGGPEVQVDTYGETRSDGAWLWSSPVLSPGPHTLKVRVTGLKNAKASGSYITADRVDVVNRNPNLLGNAGFESGLGGWTAVSAGASQATVNTTTPRNGAFHLVHASASPYWAATFQTVTGLANGTYTARAWVRGSAGSHEFYVKHHGGSNLTTRFNGASGYTELVIRDIPVTSGRAEVGFWTSDATGGGWLHVDDVNFHRQ